MVSLARDTLQCICFPLRESTEYLFQYSKNIDECREEAEKLKPLVLDVNLSVERAKSRGEESKNQLSKKASSIAKEIGVICGDKNFNGVSLPPPIPEPSPSQAPAPASHFMSFESTQNAMEDILEAQRDDNNNINIVGVHGMGGAGKTTMVKQVAEKIIREGLFRRVVMATVSQNFKLKNIQSSIADGLGHQLKVKSDEGRADELRAKIMADKKILIILDDIWEWIDLSIVGIPFGSDLEACKSKILLTKRREHVCHLMGCKENKIHLNILSPDDSWDLFIKTAGTVFDSPEFEAVAREVAGECKRLPLDLVAVARALGDKDEGEWEKDEYLKVLDISGQVLSLPPSIRLLENLCPLYMDRCKSKNISIFGGLKRLEILGLKKSLINTFQEELAELAELRMLDMTSCNHIQTISPKIISRLHGLEELYLQGSFCQCGGGNQQRKECMP
ncbi:hypothetical protein CMV_027882 [Castanea mollissima]|uniref:NB-ARC domain-containing protein n=1 Tax=Castanea mollissima TaxID=60419 RepID=A0A8J4VER7_9ROSI|nr:hypothetical protein CMV_027882 [Castanea mollissima]